MTLRAFRWSAVRCAPLLFVWLSSCEKDGSTPSFIRILEPKARTADGSEVVPSAVTDMWVYANDEAIGVWQENRRIPVLSEGSTNIKIVAGVRRNGITQDRVQYPFYATWSQDVELTLGQEVVMQPVFSWYAEPIWEEGFETSGFQFDFSEGGLDLQFVTDPDDVLRGQRSAAIVLDSAHAFFRAVTTAAPTFPNGTAATFLEFDHKSDKRFVVGVKYDNGQAYTVPYVVVNPTGSTGSGQPWKHMYIDLSSAWGTGGSVNRQFYIEAQLEGAETARIILDNMTVHH